MGSKFGWWESVKPYASVLFLILLVAVFLESPLFVKKGLLGILLFILCLVVYRIIKGRHSLMLGIRQAETLLWGKPLDRMYWDKGELKRIKKKFVWRRKRNEQTKS